MGEEVSVAVCEAVGLAPWGTGHFISLDTFSPSVQLTEKDFPVDLLVLRLGFAEALFNNNSYLE
jgi:hypothetical protein